MKNHRGSILFVVVVAVVIWWLLRAPPAKQVHGDVELGDPIVTASDSSTQAGASDYYTKEN